MSGKDDEELSGIFNSVIFEVDRQDWRSQMAKRAYERGHSNEDDNGQMSQLWPVLKKDERWKVGNWAACVENQRRLEELIQ